MMEISVKGWDHLGCGPWEMQKVVPLGWKIVADGISETGDRCLVGTTRAIKMSKTRKRYSGKDKLLPGKWVPVDEYGIPIKEYFAVIRKAAL